jgi:hypothetical protein
VTTETDAQNNWPRLPAVDAWEDTYATVHMWAQIVGKIRLGLFPAVNHYWGCTLYVTARGLTTMPMPYEGGTFTIDFDFVGHALRIARSNGAESSFPLEAMPVAAFYGKLREALASLGIRVKIYARPVEVVEAIPFARDTRHASYDADAVNRVWRALAAMEPVFEKFRAEFIGKASPVHFFWGSFDLAATRFSGRTAPKHPGGAPNCPDRVMLEAYSHELSSAGFWPGAGLGEAAFYSYAYPAPAGFGESPVRPEAAYFHEALGEFILPYEAVRAAESPEQALLAFLRTTYAGAATLGGWDRAALERAPATTLTA